MSQEWSSPSTSKLAHRAAKSLHLFAPSRSLNTHAAPEEDAEVDNAAVSGGDLRNVPRVDMTPSLFSAGDPDPYYPPSPYPTISRSMYTARESTDATTSYAHSRDRHAQYANMRLPVPYSTPPLPSANFPSSIGGSEPPTATAAEFSSRTSRLGISSYYYGASVNLDTDLSRTSALKSEIQPQAYEVSSRYLSAGVSLDSQLSPAPSSGGAVEHLQIRLQQLPSLRPPRSPAYEESDVQSSSVNPIRAQTSHLFNTIDPFHDLTENEATSVNHQKVSKSSEERHSSLIPPMIELSDGTSPFRHSFQTHATAGSIAHDDPSLPPTPTSMPFHDQGCWAEVIQSIKAAGNMVQAIDLTHSNGDQASVEVLSRTREYSSSNVSELRFSTSQGRSNSSQPPPHRQARSSDGVLPSASVTSGTDSFSAFERMSFPQPPAVVPVPGARSPWIKGIALPMPTNMTISRRSFKEPGTPTALPLSFTSVPVPHLPLESSSTPSTPRNIQGFNPRFNVVKTPSRVVVTTHDAPVPIVAIPEGQESQWFDSISPSPPSRAASPPLKSSYLDTPSAQSSGDGSPAAKSVAFSYNRRISALIHATEQLVRSSQSSADEAHIQARMGGDSEQLGALGKSSEDDPAAVVGIVRTASLSWRSKAILTRAPHSGALAPPPTIQVQRTASLEPIENTVVPPRLKTEDSVLRQGVHAYLSKAPSPSSAVAAASPSSPTPTRLKLSPSLRQPPPVREPGLFPENVDEVDEQIVSVHDVNRTGRGITSFDIRGVDTRMDQEARVEMQPEVTLYNEKDLPPIPDPRDSIDSPLPPLPLQPLSPPIVPPPVILSADAQSQLSQGSSQRQRQESYGSEMSTRVSSLLSRLSKTTMHSTPANSTRKSRRGMVVPPPFPPPPLPLPLTPSQMQFPRFRDPDGGMVDHELMERAGTFERMAQDGALPWQSGDRNQTLLPAPNNPPLDEAYLFHWQNPQQVQGSKGKGYVHKSAVGKSNSIRSMFSGRSDRSKRWTPNHAALGSSGANRSTSGDGNGWFTQLDDEKRKRDGQMRTLGVDLQPHQDDLRLGPDVRSRNAGGPSPRKRKWANRNKWVAVALLLLALICLIVGLAVIFSRSASNNQTATCTGLNATGRFCDIDKTCVCTSNVSGQCNAVARTIVDLVPRMNKRFNVNFAASNVSLALWDLLGDPLNDCSKQALLIDVAPGLAVWSTPNRTEFARSAILYSFMETGSLNTTAAMRSFIANTDFSGLNGQDGPVQDNGTAIGFTFGADGFIYNFASMTFHPPPISWRDNSQAPDDQISRVGSVADSALDRMYSFSTASSVQQSTALQRYWTSVLQLPSNQLDTFLNALRDAPIVLPFDATSDSVSKLMSLSTTTSFPPPAACYPGLPGVDRADIDTVETNAFGLPSSDPVISASFDVGCFASRPTYGILNVLNLRLPFADGRQGLTIQASQLTKAAGRRAVLKAGEQLVGLARASAPSAHSNTPIPALDADPRQYGTLLHLNHVALAYLQKFPTTALAVTAARFIMSSPRFPPNQNSSLFLDTNDLLNIPIIEVSVFGRLSPADMDYFYSNFAGPQGQLFFGTPRGDVFRTWALRNSSNTLFWSTKSIAQTVIREVKEPYTPFEDVWKATLKGLNTTTDSVVSALTKAGLFSS